MIKQINFVFIPALPVYIFLPISLLLFKKTGIWSYTVGSKVSVILINTCYLYIVKYKHLSYFISLLFLNFTVFMTAYPRKSPSGICTNNKLTSNYYFISQLLGSTDAPTTFMIQQRITWPVFYFCFARLNIHEVHKNSSAFRFQSFLVRISYIFSNKNTRRP